MFILTWKCLNCGEINPIRNRHHCQACGNPHPSLVDTSSDAQIARQFQDIYDQEAAEDNANNNNNNDRNNNDRNNNNHNHNHGPQNNDIQNNDDLKEELTPSGKSTKKAGHKRGASVSQKKEMVHHSRNAQPVKIRRIQKKKNKNKDMNRNKIQNNSSDKPVISSGNFHLLHGKLMAIEQEFRAKITSSNSLTDIIAYKLQEYLAMNSLLMNSGDYMEGVPVSTNERYEEKEMINIRAVLDSKRKLKTARMERHDVLKLQSDHLLDKDVKIKFLRTSGGYKMKFKEEKIKKLSELQDTDDDDDDNNDNDNDKEEMSDMEIVENDVNGQE